MMLKTIAAGFCGALVFVSITHAETRPALGYLTSEGHTRFERGELCYNIDCSSSFNTGEAGGIREAKHSSVQRALAPVPYSRHTTDPFEWAESRRTRRQIVDLSRSYKSYELGLYPPQSYLRQATYCSVPTLVESTPLCMGGQWPFYASFLYPADNPIFSGNGS